MPGSGRERSGFGRMLGWLRGNAEHLLQPHGDGCAYCSRSARGGLDSLGLCRACADKVPWIEHVRCEICGRPSQCMDCRRRERTYFTCSRSAVQYDAVMKEWLARYKFRGDERLSGLMAHMLQRAYERLIGQLPAVAAKHGKQNGPVCVTYVPLSSQRLDERGFNQSRQLAEAIGITYRVPVLALLERVRHTDKMSVRGRYDRLEHLSGAFRMNERGCRELEQWIKLGDFSKALAETGQPAVIIVDDVYTTGSTMNECAKVLTTECAVAAYGLTWAR